MTKIRIYEVIFENNLTQMSINADLAIGILHYGKGKDILIKDYFSAREVQKRITQLEKSFSLEKGTVKAITELINNGKKKEAFNTLYNLEIHWKEKDNLILLGLVQSAFKEKSEVLPVLLEEVMNAWNTYTEKREKKS